MAFLVNFCEQIYRNGSRGVREKMHVRLSMLKIHCEMHEYRCGVWKKKNNNVVAYLNRFNYIILYQRCFGEKWRCEWVPVKTINPKGWTDRAIARNYVNAPTKKKKEKEKNASSVAPRCALLRACVRVDVRGEGGVNIPSWRLLHRRCANIAARDWRARH